MQVLEVPYLQLDMANSLDQIKGDVKDLFGDIHNILGMIEQCEDKNLFSIDIVNYTTRVFNQYRLLGESNWEITQNPGLKRLDIVGCSILFDSEYLPGIFAQIKNYVDLKIALENCVFFTRFNEDPKKFVYTLNKLDSLDSLLLNTSNQALNQRIAENGYFDLNNKEHITIIQVFVDGLKQNY